MIRKGLKQFDQETVLKARSMYQSGMSIREVADALCLSFTSTYDVVLGRLSKEDVRRIRTKDSPIDIDMELIKEFPSFPLRWSESMEFELFCARVNMPKYRVRSRIKELGLKKSFKKVFVSESIPEPKLPLKRPEPVYTNLRTPFGIADELHAGNRIYK